MTPVFDRIRAAGAVFTVTLFFLPFPGLPMATPLNPCTFVHMTD